MEGVWIDRGRLWKEKARSLQLRIRDRLRVAVDRQRQWRSAADWAAVSNCDCSTSALGRWIRRVRGLLLDHSSQPRPARAAYKFYRKRVNEDVDVIDSSFIMRMLQAVAVPVIGNACHVFMHGLNEIQIYGADKLHKALLDRPVGKPLLTVSNHVAAVDDPFVIASMLPPSVMLDARNIRWTLCATDRCFKNPMMSAFFRSVKVLPVSRGDGIYQKGMDMAISKLNNGGWVHIFPEGSRSRDGGRTIGASKRGVGRLVLDANQPPIVIPFVHTGMQDVMPIGSHFPNIGKMVTILVGDPINLEDLLLSAEDAEHAHRGSLYDAISIRITHRLQQLKAQVDRLAVEQSIELQESYRSNTERASGIWQQVDWDPFGIESVISTTNDCSPSKQANKSEAYRRSLGQHELNMRHQSVNFTFSYENGIVSKIRNFMNPTELMGFAARGLLTNGHTSTENRKPIQEIRPLNVWKQFFESNLLQQWNRI